MNKKLNTFLFIIIATILNIFIMLAFLTIGFIFVSIFLKNLNALYLQFIVPLIILISIILTFFVYHKLMGFISKKIDLEKFFHPIIKSKK